MSGAGVEPTGTDAAAPDATESDAVRDGEFALRVHELHVGRRGGRTAGRPLVDGVSLEVARGEALGIVGESGSGKSLTLRAVLGLLPRGLDRTAGTVDAVGRVGMVFQDPLSALDPLMSVGAQVAEVARHVRGLSRPAARARVLELFERVGLPDPARAARSYPHELSGGQRQRVVIALALAAGPDILLCDEPTTALDVTVQARVLDLLDTLRRDLGLTIVFVSHDIAVVARMCSRVLVMREGVVVESGATRSVIGSPQHPYTRMLLDAVLEPPAASLARTGTDSARGAR